MAPDVPAVVSYTTKLTDMAFGVNWQSERTSMGDYQAGCTNGRPDWPVRGQL